MTVNRLDEMDKKLAEGTRYVSSGSRWVSATEL
jgi:hypothetical protein